MPSASSNLPLRSSDPRRVCLIRLPKLNLGPRKREFLVYLAGALVSLQLPISLSLIAEYERI